MKKRALSLLLALLLTLSLTPAALAYDGQASSLTRASAFSEQTAAPTEGSSSVTGWAEPVSDPEQTPAAAEQHLYGASIDESEVKRVINSYRDVYYDGMTWTNETHQYMLSVRIYDEKDGSNIFWIGHGCVAFCYRLSDAAFGSLSARNVYNFTYNDVRVGDILRVNNDSHSVIVIEKYSDYVVLAEANVSSPANPTGHVQWGRTMTRTEVLKANYITTRYPASVPVSKPSNVKVSTDQSRYTLGETVKISYSADDADSYNISLWQGDYGTGTELTSHTGLNTVSATYQTSNVGTYTVYVEAVNDGGTASATCRFTVTDGKPFNVKISTDKSSYALGETVKISYSADDADSYNVSLWQGDYGTGTKLTESNGVNTVSATYQTTKAGTYTLHVEAVNDTGTTSATCRFTVFSSAPSNVKPTADRSVFVVGESFYLTVAGEDMTGFNVELWQGDYGTGTRTTSRQGFGPDERVKITLGSAGRYTIYIETYNDYGKTVVTMSINAVNCEQFADVPANAYYANAVDWAVNSAITYGTGGVYFSPNAAVTRGEAVAFLWRAMGEPSPSSTSSSFSDVSTSDYYFRAVQWAVENGITYGVSATRFDPNGDVTRGEMVTFLWRTQGEPNATGQGAWYTDAENWARSNSLLGSTVSTYATNAKCPRSDVVYYLWKTLG